MKTVYGKPPITGSVLRRDSRARPCAVEPSQTTARGFPIHRSFDRVSPGGPDPSSYPSALVPLHKPRGPRSMARNPRTGTRHIAPITGIGLPVPAHNRRGRRVTDAVLIAQARFRSGLTP